jgi:hypothetical protein
MSGRELVLVDGAEGLPAIVTSSGRRARDRIEHFLRAAIENDNTRQAYDRSRALRTTLEGHSGPRCAFAFSAFLIVGRSL